MGVDKDQTVTALERLTTTDFWDSAYQNRKSIPFDDKDWRNYSAIQMVRFIRSLKIADQKVCEVGGGDAQITCYLAKHYPNAKFSVIDFSPIGCDLARNRARAENVKLDIIQTDLFSPPTYLYKGFDLVLSLGVVEHFSDLSRVMRAKRELINDNGYLFTLIPNFESPIYTALCKKWSISVFEDHVPHSIKSFVGGHQKANLDVIQSGYLGSIEFGILSMAMAAPEKKSKFDRKIYLWLTRLSKIIHYLEYKTVDFPSTRFLSPFIYAISKKAA